MKIKQIYTSCLSQGAYYIESKGEVAIIDPLREVSQYIEKAKKSDAKIKYIFETHFHADFVSGHITLSRATGAPIVYGPSATPSFDAIIATDGQTFQLGEVTIIVLHTPGHTMESTTFLLRDAKGEDHAIFTGDTLFLGDVGRPDLAQKATDMTQEELAEILYDSLRKKIMPLADDVIVYPAHGAGSTCGKNLSKETFGTLGEQKRTNYALRSDMTKSEFVKEVIEGLLPPPQYFPSNVKMNKEGYEDVENVINAGVKALSVKRFDFAANETGAVVLDVRNPDDFARGHVPKSLFIGINDSFAPWVGALIGNVEQPILLVAPQGREEETVMRLARVGFDNTLGYLKGGVDAWKAAGKELDTVKRIEATQFKTLTDAEEIKLFDVRKPGEYTSEHVYGAENTPLDFIDNHLSEFPSSQTFCIYCAGGYRSMIASSILKSQGIHSFFDIRGGLKSIKKIKIKTVNHIVGKARQMC